ncbi:hypothetical protein T12_2527 [Trichinella patagoniensis]|uniref:Uncharacterized protein n=1 Tax=Trichinella patagoniensis TaxID=990121 RepID=A0A0V0ZYB0_9BILA|nr:hypothetical protein T12_2527 [Trichinella patagoniensis]
MQTALSENLFLVGINYMYSQKSVKKFYMTKIETNLHIIISMVSNLEHTTFTWHCSTKTNMEINVFLKLALSVASVLLHLIQYPIIDGKLEYFIHCIVMEARTCSTMILLFNINCHYERYDFTFNIHMSDEQERHPLQFHTRTFIVYCIHIVYEISSYSVSKGSDQLSFPMYLTD